MTDRMTDREILFRGKREDNGEWIEGCWLYNNKIAVKKEVADGPAYFDGEIFFRIENHKIVPNTRGQYTGLNDKNGMKIFEGDVVKAFLYNETPMIFSITFRAGCFWYGNWNFVEFLNTFRNIEVISNVHDNPELLEGE